MTSCKIILGPRRRIVVLVVLALGVLSGSRAHAFEDQYLTGDWDGDGVTNLAVRRGNCILMDTNFDGVDDRRQCYGFGNFERQYLVGNWDGRGGDDIAVRREDCVLMDTNGDGTHDLQQCYGFGRGEDQYLVGDWDGDGRDNIAVRRGNCILMDTNFDATPDITQCFGPVFTSAVEYLVGDWDGDGRDNIGVRTGGCVSMDTNFDSKEDRNQCYGFGNGEEQYLVGHWDRTRQAHLAVRRVNCLLKDTNFDGVHDLTECYGDGFGQAVPPNTQVAGPPCLRSVGTVPAQGFFVIPSEALIDTVARALGNNPSKRMISVGMFVTPTVGLQVDFEEAPSATLNQSVIVLMNSTRRPKAAIAIDCAGFAAPQTITAGVSLSARMGITTATATSVVLNDPTTGFEVAAFREQRFWSLVGGRRVTLTWIEL